jgi:hypothetical protein
MDGESNRMWKKAAVLYFEYCPGIHLKGLRKITKKPLRLVDVLAEIRPKHLPNTSEKIYCLSQCAW